jgi:hypothetical protein
LHTSPTRRRGSVWEERDSVPPTSTSLDNHQ